jgi:DNA-binding CsgD family transcriptional regulator
MGNERQSALRVAIRAGALGAAAAGRVAAALDADRSLVSADEAPDVAVVGFDHDAIAAEPEAVRVLVVGDGWDRSSACEALAAGARGVLASDEVEATLVPAVRAVASGLVVVPPGTTHASRRPVLSGREKQVLGLVVMGLTNAEIGRRLYLAESTVKYHLLSVYAKLGVRSRKEAADLVLDPQSGLGGGILSLVGGGAPRARSAAGDYAGPTVR